MMEWVYIENSDEPAVFEADAIETTDKSKKPIDIFSSTRPVEEPISEPDTEAEYYGDNDVIEELVSPVKAFETFAGKNFPVGRIPDFSGSIYAEASEAVVKPTLKQNVRRPRQLPSSETRSQRLSRISAEIDALRAEYDDDPSSEGRHALAQLSSLRDQLNEIENTITSRNLSTRRYTEILPVSCRSGDKVTNESTDNGISLHYLVPSLSALSTLERRVAALEGNVGVCQLANNCHGTSLGTILEDVQTRLALVADKNLPQKLKRDAQDIAGILQNELQAERGAEILRAATALEKMEQWKHLAESVPLVIERLRCLKRVQEEAEQFSATLAAIGSHVDTLQQRNASNSDLIENVRKSLATNVKTVQENLDILTEKVIALEKRESEPKSKTSVRRG